MSTALYRRYRPETFQDVIGQEHVTEPLMQALRSGRIGHAYLFSGPRGCGKTTSARILARCLNCAKGPTPTPCGECESCVALARGGSGSVDVIEIDAASHGGVDDARDLRERASYGPAQSRYKIYIIDEAHMVTPQGFNALLKIVEEPPEHVKFVFATTEPEKVIGTIRSRTHHYPFRLLPPGLLGDYLQTLCDAEGVPVEPGVLSFVTRAGGGSARDSLSVLDQLIAGSGEEGLTYAGAAALLGFTDGELLDAIIDAFVAHDAAAVFRQIDKVVESGHDPRRFVEDLLERLRDLIVVSAVADGAAQVLRHVPEDQLERMRQQAAAFGPGTLSRAADIANAGLTEMTGATAPRLQLELIAARILLPAASGEQGYAARLDRLERRLDLGGGEHAGRVGGDHVGRAGGDHAGRVGGEERAVGDHAGRVGGEERAVGDHAGRVGGEERAAVSRPPAPAQTEPGEDVRRESGAQAPSPEPGGWPDDGPVEPASSERPARPDHEAASDRPGEPAQGQGRPASDEQGPSGTSRDASRSPEPSAPTGSGGPGGQGDSGGRDDSASGEPAPAAAPQRTPGSIDTDAIRRAWPDVLDRIFKIKRVTWTLLSQHAQVLDYDGQRLLLGTSTQGLTDAFRRGQHPEVVRQALIEGIGVDCRIEVTVHDGPPPQGRPAPGDGGPAGSSGGFGGGPEQPWGGGDQGGGSPGAGPHGGGGAPGGPDQGGSGPSAGGSAPSGAQGRSGPGGGPAGPNDGPGAGGRGGGPGGAGGGPGGPQPPRQAPAPGGWDADSRDSWSSPSAAPPAWTTDEGDGAGDAPAPGAPGGPEQGRSAGEPSAPAPASPTTGPSMAETARREDVQPAPSPPGASPETTRTRPPQPDDDAGPDGPGPASGAPAPAPDAQPTPGAQPDAASQPSPRRRAEAAAKAQAAAAADPRRPGADDSAATYDDESVEDAGAVGVPVIQSVLGGTVIAEEED
ncbi:DNA polymerase-3 subunit gamma/tau [Barrientosiimonas humi]|uniref:DNA polymerase III subunit gamma/tau n=1 Tax=Barrientosiimonas humi TaxID=999931 RepID=A0A542WZM9_9MICO|nr:DNA polymerase III subunit gamma and tau [Barrientosiimonas humi]TQL29041.1 DNA polymerase-3 subunit gamma/tau [Barrientosiimonas humi]CAG7571544.1 DNA polymerase III subunit gamma/tau [Barrientosiimonas humi]